MVTGALYGRWMWRQTTGRGGEEGGSPRLGPGGGPGIWARPARRLNTTARDLSSGLVVVIQGVAVMTAGLSRL